MSTIDLHNIMENEISNELAGELSFDGTVLKWEYDGIDHLHNQLEYHLDITAHEDKEIIEGFLLDNDEDFVVSEPETHDTFVYFYIEK